MKIAVAFLTARNHPETISFAKKISETTPYHVAVVSDIPNTETANDLGEVKISSKFSIFGPSDTTCRANRYTGSNIGSNATHIAKDPIAWDKMLFLFCEILTEYDFVWIFEDDVFIPDISTIENLTQKYASDYDLLVPNHFLKSDTLPDWHWPKIFDKHEHPYYFSMVCAMGASRKMLNAVKNYVAEKNQLFYIESMFNTLAHHNKLNVLDIFEFKSIVWKGEWNLNEFILLPDNVFHPKKDLEKYVSYRNEIKNHSAQAFVPENNLPDFIRSLM